MSKTTTKTTPIPADLRGRVIAAGTRHKAATEKADATRVALYEVMAEARTAGLSVREVAALGGVATGTVQAAERGTWRTS